MQAPGRFRYSTIISASRRPVTPSMGSVCRHSRCPGSSAIAAGPNTTHIPRPMLLARGEPAGRDHIQHSPSRPSTSGRKNAAIPIVCNMASAR